MSGDVYGNGKSHRLLTREEERDLGKRVREGDLEARNHLASHNIRLVYSIANNYARAYSLSDAEREELIGEGMIGLIKAAGKYDPSRISKKTGKPVRFATMAVHWIKQPMQRYLEVIPKKYKAIATDPYVVAILENEGVIDRNLPPDIAFRRELSDLIDFSVLNEKEKQVIWLRYGMAGTEELTLEEVGKLVGVTRERTRQIQVQSERKLKRKNRYFSRAV